MSGVYLIVWDKKNRENSQVLRPTRGGWPHITIAYTGKELSRNELNSVAKSLLDEWMLKPITLTRAYVNRFEDKPGHVRHDVLLEVAESNEIEAIRETHFKQFTTHKPHVTRGIFDYHNDAVALASILNERFLPYEVAVTGVTID